MTPKKVPVIIVEEHHEAFFIWHYGYFNGFFNPSGNTLFHVDAHEDMVLSNLRLSVDGLNDDLSEIWDFVYHELGIANFILPAVYRGIFNRVLCFKKHYGAGGKEINRYIASINGEGRFFKTGVVNGLLPVQLQSESNKWSRYQFFTYQEAGPDLLFNTCQPLVLDIDLDYFSCDNSFSTVEKKIEITADAYREFIGDRYHCLRIMPVAALTAGEDCGRYYLYYHEMQGDHRSMIVNQETIDKRVDLFIDYLTRNKIKPAMIDLCRSRFSGYTPGEQWQYIEEKLLQGLNRLFALDVLYISDFRY